MKKKLGFCGINCSECEAFIATKNNDDNLRKETAEKWSKMFNPIIKLEDINCLGCTSKSKNVFLHCTVCEFRKCGQDRKIKNCAYCTEYPCENLSKFFTQVPIAKTNLDEIRKNVKIKK